MTKPTFSKSTLVHSGLYALIVVLIGAIGVGSYLIHSQLTQYVVQVDHLKIDSEMNEQGIVNATKLRLALEKNQDNVNRAASIVADTQYYKYQDQIVEDITAYARASGLTILGFDFSKAASSKASAVKGVNTMVANITVKSPVPYSNYLQFLKLIERNLTKMQVTQLDISNDLKTPGAISSPIITLEVYVR
jgi:hypothetical protein